MSHGATDEALRYLQAEEESAWLDQAFVPPRDYATISGRRSQVMFGQSGAGKSAILAALRQGAKAAGILAVTWRPTGNSRLPQTTTGARLGLGELIQQCLKTMLADLALRPVSLRSAPDWTREAFHWLLYTYVLAAESNPRFLLSRLTARAGPEGVALLGELFDQRPALMLQADMPERELIPLLTDTVKSMGYSGLWVLVDGLEEFFQQEPENAAVSMLQLLSSIAIFEDPHFAVKLAAPPELNEPIMASTGVTRRRVDVTLLTWCDAELAMIVERRLQLLLDRDSFALQDLYDRRELMNWLQRYGGSTPRGWLEMVRPFVVAYRSAGAVRPLTEAEWTAVCYDSPPQLYIDAQNRVLLGNSEVFEILPGPMKILRYLYDQRGHTCSRSELYYRGLLGLDHEPTSTEDQRYAAPHEWEGLLNTNLYRLRQAIELDPSRPVYILTMRGKGVRLEHTR